MITHEIGPSAEPMLPLAYLRISKALVVLLTKNQLAVGIYALWVRWTWGRTGSKKKSFFFPPLSASFLLFSGF